MKTERPILVIDDDEDIRDGMQLALNALGYPVRLAKDGADALQILDAGLRPELILLDMMMPHMDGEALMNRLRKSPDLAAIPIVLVSGHAAAEEKAARFHAAGCLVKPIELTDLAETIERVTHP